MRGTAWALALVATAAQAAEPARQGPADKLREKVVEAIRNCPKPEEGVIAVCAKDRGIAEGYRLPKMDPRFAGNKLRPSGRGTLAGPGVGAAGTGSCTASGAGGFTGCSAKDYRSWREERNRVRDERREAEAPK